MTRTYDPPENQFVFQWIFLSTETGRTYARYITRLVYWGASGVQKKEDR